jgi:hypothetical protein
MKTKTKTETETKTETKTKTETETKTETKTETETEKRKWPHASEIQGVSAISGIFWPLQRPKKKPAGRAGRAFGWKKGIRVALRAKEERGKKGIREALRSKKERKKRQKNIRFFWRKAGRFSRFAQRSRKDLIFKEHRMKHASRFSSQTAQGLSNARICRPLRAKSRKWP